MMLFRLMSQAFEAFIIIETGVVGKAVVFI